ncbi:hypothetical protein Harman_04150 [Haloarcula mannanilytica]|uniref:Uncharacterized protein n=1 Tax=Haloarcula mannanilytica TaxID=2509225 RepID=A0A4C2EGT9_9EURY|nr:hypothetical protein Harman_04150 [Haloarcula mannanilytica]
MQNTGRESVTRSATNDADPNQSVQSTYRDCRLLGTVAVLILPFVSAEDKQYVWVVMDSLSWIKSVG